MLSLRPPNSVISRATASFVAACRSQSGYREIWPLMTSADASFDHMKQWGKYLRETFSRAFKCRLPLLSLRRLVSEISWGLISAPPAVLEWLRPPPCTLSERSTGTSFVLEVKKKRVKWIVLKTVLIICAGKHLKQHFHVCHFNIPIHSRPNTRQTQTQGGDAFLGVVCDKLRSG